MTPWVCALIQPTTGHADADVLPWCATVDLSKSVTHGMSVSLRNPSAEMRVNWALWLWRPSVIFVGDAVGAVAGFFARICFAKCLGSIVLDGGGMCG